jgi:uncharacterized protein DUF4258
MGTDPILEFILTTHARGEMTRRNLTEDVVRSVLARPDQRWELRPGRHVLQSKVIMSEPSKTYRGRVIVDTSEEPAAVVTAYRTSRISKYWRQEP